MFNARFQQLAKHAGIELTEEVEFFAELIAEECADIAESAEEVDLPVANVIRRHYGLVAPKK